VSRELRAAERIAREQPATLIRHRDRGSKSCSKISRGKLPTIAANLEDIVVIDQSDDLAEAAVVRQQDGQPRMYFIYFRRNGLGQWLIEEM
jgi:hypothetical protein